MEIQKFKRDLYCVTFARKSLFCNQFGPRSDTTTKRQSLFGSKLFDNLVVFLNCFSKIIVGDKIIFKIFSTQRFNNSLFFLEATCIQDQNV